MLFKRRGGEKINSNYLLNVGNRYRACLSKAVHGRPPLLLVLADDSQYFTLAERQVIRVLQQNKTKSYIFLPRVINQKFKTYTAVKIVLGYDSLHSFRCWPDERRRVQVVEPIERQ